LFIRFRRRSGRVGRRRSGRVGRRRSGRVGRRTSGRVGRRKSFIRFRRRSGRVGRRRSGRVGRRRSWGLRFIRFQFGRRWSGWWNRGWRRFSRQGWQNAIFFLVGVLTCDGVGCDDGFGTAIDTSLNINAGISCYR